MFVRRSTHEREKVLLNVAFLSQVLGPEAVQSADVLEGIRKQLLMALPARSPVRRSLGEGRTADAYERLIALLMAASKGPSSGGGFEDFRRAVIEAAGARREYLDVLTEIHEWLDQGRDPVGVKSQLEDRLAQQGVKIVTEIPAGERPADRFNFHGEGDAMTVIAPAYVAEIGGTEQVVRRGHVECQPGPSRDDIEGDDGTPQVGRSAGPEEESAPPTERGETSSQSLVEEGETPAETSGEETASGSLEVGECGAGGEESAVVDGPGDDGTNEEKSS